MLVTPDTVAAAGEPPHDTTETTTVASGNDVLPTSVLDEVAKSFEGFDPAQHAVNPDGTPRFKVDGEFALKRGRKNGATTAIAKPGKKGPIQISSTDKTKLVGAGKAATNLLINGCVLTLGDEWVAQKDEAEYICASFVDYFEAKGMTDIPPGFALCIALLAYAVPRVTMPKTQEKISTLLSKI